MSMERNSARSSSSAVAGAFMASILYEGRRLSQCLPGGTEGGQG